MISHFSRLASATVIALAVLSSTLTASAPPASATPVAQPAAQPAARSGSFDVSVPSSALGRSVTVRVFLPAGVAPSGGWPVTYLLHGTSGQADGNRYVWSSQFGQITGMAASSHVALVMVEAGKAGYYSNWNSGPRWETFHVSELPAFLASHYSISRTRQAIAGYSMGGFGALAYAARHPGAYRAVIALSPVADPLRNPSIVLNDLRDAHSNIYALWGNPSTKSDKSTWKRHDPYYLAKGLRNTYLYVYAGKNGGSVENALRAQTLKLTGALKKLGLKKLHITLVQRTGTYGTHSYRYWAPRLYGAWPGLVRALNA